MTDSALMGKLVVVTGTLVRHIDGVTNKHTPTAQWQAHAREPRAGWIVGVRFLQNGIIIPQSRTWNRPDESCDADPGGLAITSTTKAYMVSFWPTMKPVFVRFEDMFPTIEEKPMSPGKWAWEHTKDDFQQKVRQELKDEAAKMARAKNGRFIRTATTTIKQGE